MQIDRKYKIEKCVSADPSRETLLNIYVSKKHAVATNGHVLAMVPIEKEKGDTDGWITPDTLKLARKVTPKALGTVHIGLNGAQVLPDGTTIPRPTEATPPDATNIIKAAKEDRKFTVGINASYLQSISEALGTDELVLSFSTPNSAILVKPLRDDSESLALLMPVRVK